MAGVALLGAAPLGVAPLGAVVFGAAPLDGAVFGAAPLGATALGGALPGGLRRAKGLGWFKDEHDEAPAAVLTDLPAEVVARLGDELLRTRDGQFVL